MTIDITPAVRYLDATETETGWTYYARETRSHWRVSRDDLALLAYLLAADTDPDIYGRWCAATSAEELAEVL